MLAYIYRHITNKRNNDTIIANIVLVDNNIYTYIR